MLTFVIILQVLVALFLILVVLLQPGNRGGASAALG
ncbi:MAG TPA: preprotein translocase subunit SecG, partial [Myxococcota bacterium]|nr:preprotein translocase subunit SecG [Myxococcota bacterium]